MSPVSRQRITSPYFLMEAIDSSKVAIFDTSALMLGNSISSSRNEIEIDKNVRYMAYLQSVIRRADNVISTDRLLDEATGVARRLERERLSQESGALFHIYRCTGREESI